MVQRMDIKWPYPSIINCGIYQNLFSGYCIIRDGTDTDVVTTIQIDSSGVFRNTEVKF